MRGARLSGGATASPGPARGARPPPWSRATVAAAAGEQCPPPPGRQVRRSLGSRGGAGRGARESWGGGAWAARAAIVCGAAPHGAGWELPSARPGAASPWPPPARSSPLAPAPPVYRPPPPSRALRSARPALAALPPGPHSAPQEGEGRGAVAAALTEAGGPLKGAAWRAPGEGRRERVGATGSLLPNRASALPCPRAWWETEAPAANSTVQCGGPAVLLEQEHLNTHFPTPWATHRRQCGARTGRSLRKEGRAGLGANASSPCVPIGLQHCGPGGG